MGFFIVSIGCLMIVGAFTVLDLPFLSLLFQMDALLVAFTTVSASALFLASFVNRAFYQAVIGLQKSTLNADQFRKLLETLVQTGRRSGLIELERKLLGETEPSLHSAFVPVLSGSDGQTCRMGAKTEQGLLKFRESMLMDALSRIESAIFVSCALVTGARLSVVLNSLIDTRDFGAKAMVALLPIAMMSAFLMVGVRVLRSSLRSRMANELWRTSLAFEVAASFADGASEQELRARVRSNPILDISQ